MPLTKIQSLGITDGTIVNDDINASAAITLAKLSGVNDSKAWVNFNGTGTVAIRASFNVSSITDNGTGDYTINFTNAFSDSSYSIVGCSSGTTTAYYGFSLYAAVSQVSASSLTTTSARIVTKATSNVDADVVTASIFR
jgi:hypothetical protein